MKIIESLEGFAKLIHELLRSDRDVNLGIGGMTGEGKTTFTMALAKEYSKVSGVPWSMKKNMTWSRKEVMTWIDGEKKSSRDSKTGLKAGQLQEYSMILADELFQMFYRRNWYEQGQIDAISTFNMCRDRHLLVAGNIPNFWELDGSFTSRIRFYVYIPKRGTAWVFEQENNPFCNDKWNTQENKKMFRKKKNPYSCPNFVCEIKYPDMGSKEKKEYLKIRAEKRVKSIDDNRPEKVERYSSIKTQRDALIRLMFKENKNLKLKDLADLLDLSVTAVRYIKEGMR